MYSQKNIETLFETIGKSKGQEFGKSYYYEYIKAPLSIWPNQLFNLNVSIDNLDKVLEEIEGLHLQVQLPNLLMCNPATDDKSILEKLHSKNYKKSVWTAMTHNLSLVKNKEKGVELKIEFVTDSNQLQEWLTLVERELMGSHKLDPQIFQSLLQSSNCFFYLGYADQTPVSTALLFTAKDEGGIYLVSTDSQHRKKGFGYQITNECLVKASELGCKGVHIQATDAGKNVYKSLGFKEHGAINVFRIEG